MVVFTCNTCGDSLKKSQVEKHIYTKCRSCKMVTCIDCNKDFWGDAYKEHIKCVTEAERYGGKNFKPQTFKGEAKQQEWTELLSKIIETQEMSSPVKDVFKRMQNFNNVPRKEKPFKNFLQSSMGVRNPTLAQDVWQTIKKAQETLQKTQPGNKQLEKPHVTDENGSKGKKPQHSGDKASGQQQEKEETQDTSSEDNVPGKKKLENGSAQVKVEKTKKSKKELLENTMSGEVSSEKLKKKRKRKKRLQEDVVIEGNLQDEYKEDTQDTSSEENAPGKKKQENGSAQVKVEKTKKSKKELLENTMSDEVSSEKSKKKRKRKKRLQEDVVIEGNLQDEDKEETQDTSSEENAPGKKRQENGSAEVKPEKTKKSKKELLESTASDEVSSEKSKKKRKRKKRQQEDVIEGDLQDEGKPTKKSKRQDQEGDNQTEEADESEERVRFKWKKAVKAALLEADEHQLSRKQLQKRVFKECRSKGGNLTDEEMQTKFDKVLSNIRYFEHEGDVVRLVHLAAE